MISKRAICATLAAVLVAGGAFAAELETESQQLGYMFGLDIGNSLRQQGVDVDLEAFFDAVRTAYEGGEPAMTPEEAQAIRETYIAERQASMAQEQEAQAAENLAEGQAFLATNSDAEGVMVTDSGLQYEVLEEGAGASPAASDQVTVHYRGTLLDGTEFDSSYSRDEPATFALDQVIPGWTEGVQLMSVGSKYRFWIPANLAYGEGGAGPIPPNATLIFDVELLDIQ